ncbi:MAG: 1,2-phenylacetyl-CoA epoxidase subunit PaaD [Bryobacteraceae bacterium]
MVAAQPTVTQIWDWLKEIADPEIPVLSVVDLGIVRDVRWSEDEGELIVTITPTYSGCPAMEVIAADIKVVMKEHGIDRLRLETKLSPAWTTDWMTEEAKERLRTYGIAPPPSLVSIRDAAVTCPQCGSNATELVSRFGSTPCKALYKCRSCLEPFDVFKRH